MQKITTLRTVAADVPAPVVKTDSVHNTTALPPEPPLEDADHGLFFEVWHAVADDETGEPIHPAVAIEAAKAGAVIEDLDLAQEHLQRLHRLAQMSARISDPYFRPLDIVGARIRTDRAERAKAVVGETKPLPKMLSKGEVAEILGVSEKTVDRYAADGKIPAGLKFGEGRNATVRWNAEAFVHFVKNAAA